jgi:rhamnulokinase
MEKCYLAFDLGASSGRAIIGKIEDGKMSLNEVHRFDNGPTEIDGKQHWDFDRLSGEILTGVEKALATGENISSIAIDTWGVDYLLIRSDGSPARHPYHYRDPRTDGLPDEIFDSVISESDLYSRTGIQMMQLNTIYQLAAHKRQHPEDMIDATLLLMPDALTWLLCGDMTCEYTEATTTNLLNPHTREWDWELIDKLNLPRDIFPKITDSCTTVGTLRPEICSKLNCDPIPVVKVGAHDTASAVAAVPAPETGDWCYISCGTWALLGVELDQPYISEAGRVAPFTNEGCIDGKIRYLTNIMGTWLFQETRRIRRENGETVSYNDMETEARAAEPLKFLVNPNDASLLAPADMPQAIRDFCERTGQGQIPDNGALVGCIYDSLALFFRAKVEALEKILGVKYACLNIVGGGTKDKLLMQLTANALGIPVAAGPVEATAVGNIMAQAIACDELADVKAGRELIKASFPVIIYQPDLSVKEDWDQAAKAFSKIIGG